MNIMKKKRFLAIGPILGQWENIKEIISSLDFLSSFVEIDFLDPLTDINHLTTSDSFYDNWSEKILSNFKKYDGFLGFSFGGVILQKNFNLFKKINKPLILFSSPSFMDEILGMRINTIIELLKKKELVAAVNKLNEFVLHPNLTKVENFKFNDPEQITFRLLTGFQLIMQSDVRNVVENSQVKYLHLIGEHSLLVNRSNITQNTLCQICSVPHAGMRILQDNLHFCRIEIMRYLSEWM